MLVLVIEPSWESVRIREFVLIVIVGLCVLFPLDRAFKLVNASMTSRFLGKVFSTSRFFWIFVSSDEMSELLFAFSDMMSFAHARAN